MKKNKWIRNCPECNTELFYYSRQNLWRANKNKCICRKCNLTNNSFAKNLKFSKEVIERLKKLSLGRKHTEETKLKISQSHRGKSTNPFTEETREKMRIARWRQIENLGGGPMYNPDACNFIDKLNKEKGWNLRHALNGGEIRICGYSLDGYDKDRNIVFEYDEKEHHTPIRRKKDLVRQNRILERIKPSLFLRYDEKRNTFYSVGNFFQCTST